MATETELKLSLAARDLPRLLAHPLLAGAPSRRCLLGNSYFDTPDQALRRRRVAVRERRIGRRSLLTVKTAGRVAGGLAQRSEWEGPTPPGRFDFAGLVDDPALAGQLAALAGALVPVFGTDFRRRTWRLSQGGARIEVALDRGRIHAQTARGPRQAPLLELELELLAGPVEALFALARELGRRLPLRALAASKAERGYALLRGRPMRESKLSRARPAAARASSAPRALPPRRNPRLRRRRGWRARSSR